MIIIITVIIIVILIIIIMIIIIIILLLLLLLLLLEKNPILDISNRLTFSCTMFKYSVNIARFLRMLNHF